MKKIIDRQVCFEGSLSCYSPFSGDVEIHTFTLIVLHDWVFKLAGLLAEGKGIGSSIGVERTIVQRKWRIQGDVCEVRSSRDVEGNVCSVRKRESARGSVCEERR